jgi:hypothetical protein
MPQTGPGGGTQTVQVGGPGSTRRGPLYIKKLTNSAGAGGVGGYTFNKLCDESGLVDYNALALGVMRFATVAIGNTATKALNSAPSLLVAAPGTGFYIDVDSVILNYLYLTGAFANGGVIQASYGASVTNPATSTVAATFLTAPAANEIVKLTGAISDKLSSAVLNTGVYLACATADFITGAGSLVAQVRYHILPAA